MHDWKLARGYRFAGLHCGIRPGDKDRLDLALIVSDTPASAAGVFTQNLVFAAPVQVCRERLPSRDARGVVVCAGNANACTGPQGLADARRMAELAAQSVGCSTEQMLVSSTGVIGRPLPMPALEAGIPRAARELDASVEALDRAAHAILTTDTRIKVATETLDIDGVEFRLTGIAKGAAMIGPNMATMLAFVCTDAPVEPKALQMLVRRAAAESFNCISVEGHTSTNDTLLAFANGSGPPLEGPALARFGQALTAVCTHLAREIASDAEGAKHLIRIEVEGLRDDEEARKVAKAVAESALVKTAVFGADPNWGRVVSAAGYAGVPFHVEHLSMWLGDLLLFQHGVPQAFDAATAAAYLRNHREVLIRLRFGSDPGHCTFWTCDLTPEYIRLNADYTT